jgi:hypothetical protein
MERECPSYGNLRNIMLNVSRVVLNPRFLQPITQIKRTETVNQYGESVISSDEITIQAVVTMANAQDLNRFTDATVYKKAILVSTANVINPDSIQGQPDMLIYKDETYIVIGVDSYSEFGYTRAVAALADFQSHSGD